jgi:hypothetical protein
MRAANLVSCSLPQVPAPLDGGESAGSVLASAMPAPGEPPANIDEPVALLLGFLDFLEDVTLRKISGLTEDRLRTTAVPSGWTPLGMIKHLACTERFWTRHVFLGEHVDFSWPGHPDAEWRVDDGDSTESITSFYRSERSHTRSALAGLPAGAPGQRPFHPDGGLPPTLGWVLCHLVQQAARHAGHLDIARELIDGSVGSD